MTLLSLCVEPLEPLQWGITDAVCVSIIAVWIIHIGFVHQVKQWMWFSICKNWSGWRKVSSVGKEIVSSWIFHNDNLAAYTHCDEGSILHKTKQKKNSLRFHNRYAVCLGVLWLLSVPKHMKELQRYQFDTGRSEHLRSYDQWSAQHVKRSIQTIFSSV